MNIVIITNRPRAHIVHHTNNALSLKKNKAYISIINYDNTDIWLNLNYHSIIIDTNHLGRVRTLKIIKALLKKGVHLADITDLETEYGKTD